MEERVRQELLCGHSRVGPVDQVPNRATSDVHWLVRLAEPCPLPQNEWDGRKFSPLVEARINPRACLVFATLADVCILRAKPIEQPGFYRVWMTQVRVLRCSPDNGVAILRSECFEDLPVKQRILCHYVRTICKVYHVNPRPMLDLGCARSSPSQAQLHRHRDGRMGLSI